MKELTLLTWLTQLGLSVALPLAGFIFLALWLRSQFGWGDWVLWVGIVLGFWGASVNKTDKIFGYGVYVLEREVNEQSTMTGRIMTLKKKS